MLSALRAWYYRGMSDAIKHEDMVSALTAGPLRLKRGEMVLVDGRANKPFWGKVNRLEEVRPGVWYMHLVGERLLYPVEDVLEVAR